jgi:hypothetical protein
MGLDYPANAQATACPIKQIPKGAIVGLPSALSVFQGGGSFTYYIANISILQKAEADNCPYIASEACLKLLAIQIAEKSFHHALWRYAFKTNHISNSIVPGGHGCKNSACFPAKQILKAEQGALLFFEKGRSMHHPPLKYGVWPARPCLFQAGRSEPRLVRGERRVRRACVGTACLFRQFCIRFCLRNFSLLMDLSPFSTG